MDGDSHPRPLSTQRSAAVAIFAACALVLSMAVSPASATEAESPPPPPKATTVPEVEVATEPELEETPEPEVDPAPEPEPAPAPEQAPEKAPPSDESITDSATEPTVDFIDTLTDTDVQQAAPGETPSATARASSSLWSKGVVSQRARISSVVQQDGPTAAQRMTRVDVSRDLRKKTITATATLAGTPTSGTESVIYVYFGSWSGNTCERKAVIAGAAYASDTMGQFDSPQSTISVKKSRSGKAVKLTTKAHSRARSENLNCAYALNTNDSSTTVFTGISAVSLKNTFKPKMSISRGKSLQGNYKGKTTRVTVKVSNASFDSGSAKNVVLRASGKGLKIATKAKKLGTVAAGKNKSFTFKVKVTKGTLRTLKIKATASGGYSKSTSVKIGVKPKKKKYSSLSGRYFWGSVPTTLSDYHGWVPRGVYFVNKKWAYVSIPKNGKTPRCTKTTKTCKRYAYKKKSGMAKIGKQRFKVTTSGFTFKAKKADKKTHFEHITLPKKGSRFSAKLIRNDWTGYCILSCTTTSERLQLGKNGKFVWARSSIGSWPGLGSGWAIIPPDQRGTYRVTAKGKILLRYSSGKKERYFFGLAHDLRGKASASEGVVLGGTNFYRP